MNKVYFIIPVYNVEKYLRRCINSVLEQTCGENEIVLIDDGSPDSSPRICDEYAKKYANVKVIHKKNGGLSDARNAGLLYVRENADKEDFITFLDSDDFVHKDYVRKMLELCEKYGCDIVQCGYEKGSADFFEENSVTDSFFKSAEEALLGYSLKSQCCAKLYKLKTFDNINFPADVINEDEFVTYRAVYNANSVAFTEDKLYYYYQHETSIMDNVAKKLKDNPHRYDYLKAYGERIRFFEEKNKPEQVKKTYEKICTDVILRYCEQMYLNKNERDTDCVNGGYIRLYRKNFRLMIKGRKIPLKRRLMYIAFYIFPYSGVLMGRIFTLRK